MPLIRPVFFKKKYLKYDTLKKRPLIMCETRIHERNVIEISPEGETRKHVLTTTTLRKEDSLLTYTTDSAERPVDSSDLRKIF